MSRMTDAELLFRFGWSPAQISTNHPGVSELTLVGLRRIESEARRRVFVDVVSSCCHKKLETDNFGGRIAWVCGSCKSACVSSRKETEARDEPNDG